MLVGELLGGDRVMSPRTRDKLNENCALLLEAVYEGMPVTQEARDRAERLIGNALCWTADDVLAQAVADGYTSQLPGVL